MNVKIHAIRLGYGVGVLGAIVIFSLAIVYGIDAFEDAIGTGTFRILVGVIFGSIFILAIAYFTGFLFHEARAQKEDLDE